MPSGSQPIYISGVARAGSTILLETLAQHPDLASHRYRDYPPVFTPYWWNRFLDRVPHAPPRPRSGRIATASPSRPRARRPSKRSFGWPSPRPARPDAKRGVLERDTAPEFEAFYRDHIRKLVRVRGGRRYLSKDNYNVSRLEYLLELFPDAGS